MKDIIKCEPYHDMKHLFQNVPRSIILQGIQNRLAPLSATVCNYYYSMLMSLQYSININIHILLLHLIDVNVITG